MDDKCIRMVKQSGSKDFKPRTACSYSFSGPSIGASIAVFLPLLALKLLGALDISWIWVTCPLWLGWVAVFSIWLWLSTVSIVCQSLRPPVSLESSITEKEEEKNDAGRISDGL